MSYVISVHDSVTSQEVNVEVNDEEAIEVVQRYYSGTSLHFTAKDDGRVYFFKYPYAMIMSRVVDQIEYNEEEQEELPSHAEDNKKE